MIVRVEGLLLLPAVGRVDEPAVLILRSDEFHPGRITLAVLQAGTTPLGPELSVDPRVLGKALTGMMSAAPDDSDESREETP